MILQGYLPSTAFHQPAAPPGQDSGDSKMMVKRQGSMTGITTAEEKLRKYNDGNFPLCYKKFHARHCKGRSLRMAMC